MLSISSFFPDAILIRCAFRAACPPPRLHRLFGLPATVGSGPVRCAGSAACPPPRRIVRLGSPVCRIRLQCIECGTIPVNPFAALKGGCERKGRIHAVLCLVCGLPAAQIMLFPPDILFLVIEYGIRSKERRQKNGISVYRYRYSNIYL
ncbi:hypothetical protein SDC9_122701 [bioreactor metagenome]|uniref:Uncharacterized protein n=1 Tax=bioreactor metagenome TaxID=1076179 RepID=A0A645CFI0_9ZZZZ